MSKKAAEDIWRVETLNIIIDLISLTNGLPTDHLQEDVTIQIIANELLLRTKNVWEGGGIGKMLIQASLESTSQRIIWKEVDHSTLEVFSRILLAENSGCTFRDLCFINEWIPVCGELRIGYHYLSIEGNPLVESFCRTTSAEQWEILIDFIDGKLKLAGRELDWTNNDNLDVLDLLGKMKFKGVARRLSEIIEAMDFGTRDNVLWFLRFMQVNDC